MKRIALYLIFSALILRPGWSQLDPLYTQFMTNPFLINPALAGTYPYYQVNLNSRLQWVGISDAPLTTTLSMFGPMVNQPMGLGGFITHDATGPTSQTSINVTYAYNYSIAEDLKISLGLMVGGMQYRIGELTMNNPDDPIYQEGEVFKKFKPDATVGLYVYSSTYHGGFSVTNLFGNKPGLETDSISADGRMVQNYYLHGGYKYFINRELSLEPSIIFRKASAIPIQMDLNCRVWYAKRQWDDHKVWGGISYRTSESISILVGFSYQKKIEIGYGYDIGIGGIRSVNSGSHELMIGFKFNDIKDY